MYTHVTVHKAVVLTAVDHTIGTTTITTNITTTITTITTTNITTTITTTTTTVVGLLLLYPNVPWRGNIIINLAIVSNIQKEQT